MFNKFAQECLLTLKNKEQQAEAIIWYHYKSTGESDITIGEICHYFERALLPKANVTRMKQAFSKSKNVCHGKKLGTYRLTLPAVNNMSEQYGNILVSDPELVDIAGVNQTPYLDQAEIEQAQRMAELYIVLHCYENSARKLIQNVLHEKLGDAWWTSAANSAQKNKVQSRIDVERKNSWLTPRGSTPLFYLDWGDLLSLVRKYEQDFLPYVKDIKFVELRFEELERIRNITAHNGYLPNEEDFHRVVLSFRDWCRQVK